MKRHRAAVAKIGLALALPLMLGACYDAYGPGPGYAGGPPIYDAYYDGFYGPYGNGYWGPRGVYYYRDVRGRFRPDRAGHFRRDAHPGFNAVHGFHHDGPHGPPPGRGRGRR